MKILSQITFIFLDFPNDFSIQYVNDLAPIAVEILFEAFSASKRLEQKAGIGFDAMTKRLASN